MSDFDGRLAEAMDRALLDLDANTFTPEETDAATRALERLHKINHDRQQLELEYQQLELEYVKSKLEENKQLLEEARAEQQFVAEKKDRTIRHVIEAAGIVLPIGFYWVWMRRGFKFEETGAVTSTTFRNLISKFRLTK